MTWLLKLYPPRWRRRYGPEFVELIAAQQFSIGAVVDVVAGAIDAWIHPQLSQAKGETTMLAKMMHLSCAGYGPQVSNADVRKSAVMTLGGTLTLVLVWLVAVQQFRGNPYVVSLAHLTYFIPLLLGLRYTSLKGRSVGVQAIFIAGLLVALTAISLIATWLSVRY